MATCYVRKVVGVMLLRNESETAPVRVISSLRLQKWNDFNEHEYPCGSNECDEYEFVPPIQSHQSHSPPIGEFTSVRRVEVNRAGCMGGTGGYVNARFGITVLTACSNLPL